MHERLLLDRNRKFKNPVTRIRRKALFIDLAELNELAVFSNQNEAISAKNKDSSHQTNMKFNRFFKTCLLAQIVSENRMRLTFHTALLELAAERFSPGV